MRHNLFSAGTRRRAAVLVGVWLFGAAALLAQGAPPAPPSPDQMLSPDQLNDLVAPVALYPDPLLSQVLVASTYPLEVVQAYQWQQRNPGLTGPALTQAAQEQNWDASVQALVIYPDVLKRLNDDVAWTTNLGNAFLAQQAGCDGGGAAHAAVGATGRQVAIDTAGNGDDCRRTRVLLISKSNRPVRM